MSTLKITVTGLDEARAALTQFSDRRFNAAVATALTRTAIEARDAVRQQMPSVFDRPTPYTLNSLFVRPATAERLEAQTYFKDDRAGSGTPATRYLLPQVEGGARNTKRFELALRAAGHLPAGWFVVPGAGAKLDAFGNISRGQITQVLSQLRITLTAGFTRNMPFDARKQITAQRRAGGRFFVIKPGAKGAGPGVYQREFGGRNITPVFVFVNRASYTKRFDFFGIARSVADRRLGPNLDRAIAESAARLAARGAPK